MIDRQKLPQRAIGLTLIALLLPACSVLQPQATPTPTLVPPTATTTPFVQEGHWEMVGDSYSPVSFDITADGMVRNFRILIDGDCDVQVNVAFPIGPNHVFVFGEVDSEGEPDNNGIVGTFDSPTTVTGSFANPWTCGNTWMFLPSATWNAEWQGP